MHSKTCDTNKSICVKVVEQKKTKKFPFASAAMSAENTHFGYIPQYLLNFKQSNPYVYELISPATKSIILELPTLHTLIKELRNIVRQLLYPHFDEVQQSIYARSIDTEIRKYYAFLLRHCISMENKPHELLHLGYIVRLCMILYHPWYRNQRQGIHECEATLLQVYPGVLDNNNNNHNKQTDLWIASRELLRLIYPASIRWNMQVYLYVCNPIELECVANGATIQMVNKPHYTSLLTDLLNALKSCELIDDIELTNILTQSSRNPEYDVDTIVDWCMKLISQPLLSIPKLVEDHDDNTNNTTVLENVDKYLPASFDLNKLRVSAPEMLAVSSVLNAAQAIPR